MTDERPVCWMCAEGAAKDGAEIERLQAKVADLKTFLASMCDPRLTPCAENFVNAQARARQKLDLDDKEPAA